MKASLFFVLLMAAVNLFAIPKDMGFVFSKYQTCFTGTDAGFAIAEPAKTNLLNEREKTWSVAKTNEGILLTNLNSNEIVFLDYLPLISAGQLELIKANFIGEWTNVSALEGENVISVGSFINYSFNKNGTFSFNYGNQNEERNESGQWEVSKDGQYLLLSNNGTSKVIRIEQIDGHGLTLEQVMRSSDVNDFFSSKNKTFTFIK